MKGNENMNENVTLDGYFDEAPDCSAQINLAGSQKRTG